MAKKAEGLSAVAIPTMKPGRHADGGNLFLLVKPSGARSWVFRYKRAGKLTEIGLGSASGKGAVTLKDARRKAAGLLATVREGVNPLAARAEAEAAAKAEAARKAALAITFEAAAGLYIAANEAGWRNPKHRQQWRNTLATYAFPAFGAVPVGEVETGHVMRVLEPIWHAKPETASRLRGRIETVLDFGKARGWRTGENPARWRGHVEQMLPKRSKVARVEHHAALPWREVGPFMAELAKAEGIAALALRFAILTAARTGEVIGATWGEIDLSERMWTIPGERMKAGRPHRQPLSTAALDVLHEAAKLRLTDDPGAAVFPGGSKGHLSGMAMAMLLRRMKRDDLTVHGFRSTFRDWASETTAFAHEVAEMALAHAVGDKVEAAYRRGDLLEKRRALMEAWAKHCATVEQPAGSVTPIRAVA